MFNGNPYCSTSIARLWWKEAIIMALYQVYSKCSISGRYLWFYLFVWLCLQLFVVQADSQPLIFILPQMSTYCGSFALSQGRSTIVSWLVGIIESWLRTYSIEHCCPSHLLNLNFWLESRNMHYKQGNCDAGGTLGKQCHTGTHDLAVSALQIGF